MIINPYRYVVSGKTPDQVSGLNAWYDATDIDTLFQDSSKTTPVTANDDPVGCWADKSGNAYDVTNAVALRYPTYKSSGINSLPSVQGDGGDILTLDYTTPNVPPLALNSFEFFVVVFHTGSSGLMLHLCETEQNGGGATTTRMYSGINAGVADAYARAGGSVDSGDVETSGVTSGVAYLCQARGAGGTFYSSINNSAEESGSFTNATATLGPPKRGFSLFGFYTPYSESRSSFMTGQIAVVVIYTGALSAGDRVDIQNYLNDKWAIY